MISFVVPAHNEERFVGACVASIGTTCAELGLGHEVIVVNDASTDRTGEAAAGAGARVIEVDLRHIAAVRNAGARVARGDRLVFVDADSRIDVPLLRAAMRALDAGYVGGGAGARFEEEVPWWAQGMLWIIVRAMRLGNWAAGSFLFCRREAFEAVGGFDESVYAGEEIYTSKRLKTQGRFVVLRETIVTSARKVHGRTFGDMMKINAQLFARGPRGLRDRKNLDFWYRDRR